MFKCGLEMQSMLGWRRRRRHCHYHSFLGRLDGQRVDVLHILVAQPSHRVPRAQRDQRGGRTVARNRTANDGPQQHGAEAEQAAAQHAVGGTALRLDRLQMGSAPQVQGGADQRVQQQKVGHVLGGDEADGEQYSEPMCRSHATGADTYRMASAGFITFTDSAP